MTEFVILNISDLHIKDPKIMPQQAEILSEFAKEFKDYIDKHIDWHPDFIVLPGDVVDTVDEKSYNHAKKILKKIAKGCQISDNHIIIVPGNHDKKVSTCIKNYIKLAENFDQFCHNKKGNLNIQEEFISIHKEDFKWFNDFCKFFTSEEEGVSYISPHQFTNNEEVKYLTGLKVFHEKKICFLIVNTEWKHTHHSIKAKLKESKKEHFKKMADLNIGTSIIVDLCREIKAKYLDYTIITLMHRKPEELPWEVRNHTDEAQQDVLSHLEHYTDILITGHDHSIKTQVPDLIKNTIQHFRLGSHSCDTKTESENFPHSISAIKINPVRETVALLRGSYLAPSSENAEHWKFTEVGEYKLRDKFWKKALQDNHFNVPEEGLHRIMVKNDNALEVEKRIKEDFHCEDKCTEIDLQIQEINSKKEVQIDDKRLKHLILYYINYHEHGKENLKDIMEQYKTKILHKYEKDIILMNIVVNFVVIELPLKFRKDSGF